MMKATEAERLVAAFGRDGWVMVRSAVASDVMSSLQRQVEAELQSPSIAAESGGVSVSLHRRETWPAGEARRVVEVTPPGEAPHWQQLTSSPQLKAALDALLGQGCWELPVNSAAPATGGRVPVRHWYAPVTFPDDPHTSSEPVLPALEAQSGLAWAPVNRRGELWRGWHVDIGPGFPTDAQRTFGGHPFQGCVVLLLGSRWLEGGGGTALIRGSHRWVGAALRAAGERGLRHDELNTWASREAAARREAGVLRLASEAAPGAEPEVVQVCGEAGDVVLVHPWLVHGGSCNKRAAPRLLLNGMARVSEAAFASGGVRTLRMLGAAPGRLGAAPLECSPPGPSLACASVAAGGAREQRPAAPSVQVGGDGGQRRDESRRAAAGAGSRCVVGTEGAGRDVGEPDTESELRLARVRAEGATPIPRARAGGASPTPPDSNPRPFPSPAASSSSPPTRDTDGDDPSESELLLPLSKRRAPAAVDALAAEVARLALAAEAGPRRVPDPSLPRVSLIVPAHNAAWCLGEALGSVLAQVNPLPPLTLNLIVTLNPKT